MTSYRYQPGHSQIVDLDLDLLDLHGPDGSPITEASLERDAREAEVTGLIPGGKSVSGDGSHSPVLRVVVPHDTANLVRQRAAAERMSVSRYLRRIITNAVHQG